MKSHKPQLDSFVLCTHLPTPPPEIDAVWFELRKTPKHGTQWGSVIVFGFMEYVSSLFCRALHTLALFPVFHKVQKCLERSLADIFQCIFFLIPHFYRRPQMRRVLAGHSQLFKKYAKGGLLCGAHKPMCCGIVG